MKVLIFYIFLLAIVDLVENVFTDTEAIFNLKHV